MVCPESGATYCLGAMVFPESFPRFFQKHLAVPRILFTFADEYETRAIEAAKTVGCGDSRNAATERRHMEGKPR